MILTHFITMFAVGGSPDSDDVAALKATFPAFAAVPNDTVLFWLGRAARQVDSAWPDADRDFGRRLLACHLMTEQGLGTGAEAEMFGAGAGGFDSLKSGSLTLTRAAPNVTGATGAYGTTQYGRQFAVLAMQVRGGARVTDTGVFPVGYPWGTAWA